MSSFLLHLLYLTGGGILLRWWWADLRNHRRGNTHEPHALPGATRASYTIVIVGCVGALLLLSAESILEIKFGLYDQQSTIAWHFLFAMLAAAVVEEVIFRGYLVLTNRGPVLLWLSIFAFSVMFALLHPFLWNFDAPNENGSPGSGLSAFQLDLSPKAWFSTAFIFVNSIWFYALRFNAWNREHSLLPCFAAHFASNIGVFAVKATQGFVAF